MKRIVVLFLFYFRFISISQSSNQSFSFTCADSLIQAYTAPSVNTAEEKAPEADVGDSDAAAPTIRRDSAASSTNRHYSIIVGASDRTTSSSRQLRRHISRQTSSTNIVFDGVDAVRHPATNGIKTETRQQCGDVRQLLTLSVGHSFLPTNNILQA